MNYQSFFKFNMRKSLLLAGGIFLCLLVVTVALATASTNTIPGDALYRFKVNVVEPFVSLFHFTTEGSARRVTVLASTRIREFEPLLFKEHLTETHANNLRLRFKNLSDVFFVAATRLETSNAPKDFLTVANINSDFEAMLRAHERILVSARDVASSTQLEINSVLVMIRDAVSTSASAYLRAEEKAIGAFSADEMKRISEESKASFGDIYEHSANLIKQLGEKYGETRSALPSNRLLVSENIKNEGDVKFAANLFGEAFQRYEKARRICIESNIIAELSEILYF